MRTAHTRFCRNEHRLRPATSPTSWREKGTYTLRVNCEGEGGTVQTFATRGFEVIGEAELAPGENSVRFTLEDDDKYFMLLIRSGENEIRLTNLELLKE